MNWLEKVRFLIEKSKNKKSGAPYFYDINPKEITWELNELEKITINYNWLPKQYIEFLREFDGIAIAFCRFYGSKRGIAIPLEEQLTQHKPLLKDKYFPFGHYADGSIFIFDKQGRVCWWDKYDYDFEQKPKILAETFEEFVGECLLGKRYNGFAGIDNNTFYKFLESQGWA